jgi:hypothetical protein
LAEIGVVILAMSAIVVWIRHFGMIHPMNYDTALIPNMAWVQLCGYRPGIDFPCTLPPFFLWGAKWAMQLWGVTWESNICACAAYAALTFGWTYALLRVMALGRLSALLIAIAAQATTNMYISYWWYNALLSASSIVLFLATFAWLRRPTSSICMISFAAALFLQLLQKPNGLLLAVAACAVLIVSPAHRRRTLATMAAVVVGILALAYGMSLDLLALLRAYPEILRTRGNVAVIRDIWRQYPTMCAIELSKVVLLALVAVDAWRVDGRLASLADMDRQSLLEAALLAGALGTSLALFLTNSETKMVDTALAVTALAVLALQPRCRVSVAALGLLVLVIVYGLDMGRARHRTWVVAPGFFWEPSIAPGEPQTKFCAHMRSGERFNHLTREMGAVLTSHPGARVFLGPWLEWAYPAYDILPPRHFPIWWHKDTSYFEKDIPYCVEAFQQKQFDLLIFPKGLAENVPMYTRHWRLSELVAQSYTPDDRYGTITVWYPKAHGSPTGPK